MSTCIYVVWYATSNAPPATRVYHKSGDSMYMAPHDNAKTLTGPHVNMDIIGHDLLNSAFPRSCRMAHILFRSMHLVDLGPAFRSHRPRPLLPSSSNCLHKSNMGARPSLPIYCFYSRRIADMGHQGPFHAPLRSSLSFHFSVFFFLLLHLLLFPQQFSCAPLLPDRSSYQPQNHDSLLT